MQLIQLKKIMRNPENLRRYCSRSFNNSMSQMLFIEQNSLSPPLSPSYTHTRVRAHVPTHTYTVPALTKLTLQERGAVGVGKGRDG